MKIHPLKNLRKYLLFAVLVIFSITLTTKFNSKIENLPLEMLNKLEDVAYAAEIASGPGETYKLWVHAYYISKESIIYNLWSANYPELSFIVIIPELITYVNNKPIQWEILGGEGFKDYIVKIILAPKEQEPPKEGEKEEEIDNNPHFEMLNITNEGYYGEPAPDGQKVQKEWRDLFPRGPFAGFYYLWKLKPQTINLGELNTGCVGDPAKVIPEEKRPPDNKELKPRDEIDLTKGVNVIAVKTWNWNDKNTDIPFTLSVSIKEEEAGGTAGTATIGGKIPIKIGRIPNKALKLNIDNVAIVRENIKWRKEDKYPIQFPKPGQHYTGDPGQWFVTRRPGKTRRSYRYIMETLAEIQIAAANTGKAPVYPPSGNGLDWVEVAGTEIYNPKGRLAGEVKKYVWGKYNVANFDVTNCVWQVNAAVTTKKKDPQLPQSGVLTSVPFLVCCSKEWVNNSYGMRTNSPGISYFAYNSPRYRDVTIVHEALHSYQWLPGKDVNDEETGGPIPRIGDMLCVKSKNDDQNIFVENAFDNKRRGFVIPEVIEQNGKKYFKHNKLERWTSKGLSGDSVLHDSYRSYFIQKVPLTSKEVLWICNYQGGTKPKSQHSKIPKDIPYSLKHNAPLVFAGKVMEAFLFNEEQGKSITLDDSSFIKLYASKLEVVNEDYGQYYPTLFYLGFPQKYQGTVEDRKDFYYKIERTDDSNAGEGYSLYVRYQIIYLNKNFSPFDMHPTEFDACYYGSLRHNPRK